VIALGTNFPFFCSFLKCRLTNEIVFRRAWRCRIFAGLCPQSIGRLSLLSFELGRRFFSAGSFSKHVLYGDSSLLLAESIFKL
jgi:hypothetical protein